MDIDPKVGIRRTFDLIGRTITGRIMHPYSVQQLLIGIQKIDPGYRLITHPELAAAVSRSAK